MAAAASGAKAFAMFLAIPMRAFGLAMRGDVAWWTWKYGFAKVVGTGA